MNEEVYLSNLEWIKTHDNIGGVKGNIILKNCISYEDYRKLFNITYYILTTKDEIETLNKRNKEIYEGFIATTEELCEANKEIERLKNIINEFEILLQQDLENEKDVYWTNITKEDYIQFMLSKLQELKGSDKE